MKLIFKIILFSLWILIYSCSTKSLDSNTLEKIYYENNVIKAVISKKDGKLNGVSNYYDINSNLINSVNYMNNLLHGFWIEYFENGVVKYKVLYNYGLKDGSEIWYYDNSNIKSEVVYDNGEIISDILRWDYDGNIIIK